MDTAAYYQHPAQNLPVPEPRPSVGFGQALKNNFKYIFHFSGRASRSEFWWVFGAFFAVAAILSTIAMFMMFDRMKDYQPTSELMTQYMNGEISYDQYQELLAANTQPNTGLIIMLGLVGIWSLITLVCTIAVSWRRLQDAGFHGALFLLSFVGLSIVPFIMYFFASSPNGYKYDTAKDVGRP